MTTLPCSIIHLQARSHARFAPVKALNQYRAHRIFRFCVWCPTNWRFRVPDQRCIEFDDGRLGPCAFTSLRDFGDFLVWRKDGVPAYELAVVVDDAAMQISEVVRGEDLLISTARQILLYEALGLKAPAFYHTPLLCDTTGQRLAKRNRSLTLRELRDAGQQPENLRKSEDWWSGLED